MCVEILTTQDRSMTIPQTPPGRHRFDQRGHLLRSLPGTRSPDLPFVVSEPSDLCKVKFFLD